MTKMNKDFEVVKEPASDFLRAKKELMRLRFAKALGDSTVAVNRFKNLRRFSARCLTQINRGENVK